jgi:universal stress protein E
VKSWLGAAQEQPSWLRPAVSDEETAMATGKATETILAAVADTGASGQVAARKAVELAWLLGTDVVLYHACYEPSLSGRPFFDSPRLASARREFAAQRAEQLERVASSIVVPGVEVRTRVEWQRAIPDAVARAAMRERARLVVAEPRFSGARRRLGLSHTDWELARLCPVPVLMCRTAAPYSKPTVIAAVDPGAHGLRPSSLDVGIVNLAALIAKVSGGTTRVVHCLKEPGRLVGVKPATLRRERQRIRGMLRHLALGAGLGARAVRMVYGEPAQALVDEINETDADVVVMGTVVRGPIRQLLIGSTTERVMHVAPCDMLLVRPGVSTRLGSTGRATGVAGSSPRR